MNVSTNIEKAVNLVGLQPLAKSLNVSYQAVRKWQRLNKMPRTEWTGETQYSETIERVTSGKVTKDALLKAA